MIRRPPRSTRTDTLFPYTTLFRSGLGEFTYPIEIGIAAWRAPNLPVETWSSLISPPMAWGQHRIWSREGEAVHGISREELAGGISPLEALTKANELIGGHTAYCEGGEHDLDRKSTRLNSSH